jgi:hypothetical protein
LVKCYLLNYQMDPIQQGQNLQWLAVSGLWAQSRYLAMDSHVTILSRDRVLMGSGLVTRFIAHFWFPHSKDHCNCSTYKVFCVFTSHFLVTDPNKVLSLRRYGLANIPHLTHCSICPGYNISAWTTQKTPLIVVVQLFPWKHICLRSGYSATALVCLSRGRCPSTGLHATK